jgi:hypothetical protein
MAGEAGVEPAGTGDGLPELELRERDLDGVRGARVIQS